MDDPSVDDDLAEAYDLVDELRNEGQPPSPDWRRVNIAASRLAEVAAGLHPRSRISER
jgi:hypothetical protein